jgi:hypothetical protein
MIRVTTRRHSCSEYPDAIPNTPNPTDEEGSSEQLQESDDEKVEAHSPEATVEHGASARQDDIEDEHKDSHREVCRVRGRAAHICFLIL